MKLFTVLSIIFCLIIANSAPAQSVAIFFDPQLVTLGVNDAAGFANLLVDELGKKNVSAEIVDSDGLLAYMEANPEGIMLVCQGIFPGTVFQSEGDDDPIYDWLREGGIGGFVGDYPFYYWDNTNNMPGGGGQQSVFGATVTNASTANVEPTELGLQYIPSLQDQWTTNRPVGLAALQNNGFEFESYADDGNNSDPVAYRTEDMLGWFINFHTSCCGTPVPANDQMAIEYAELISNRFASERGIEAVDPAGKVSALWGRLKSGI
jgi:hypothetical protein